MAPTELFTKGSAATFLLSICFLLHLIEWDGAKQRQQGTTNLKVHSSQAATQLSYAASSQVSSSSLIFAAAAASNSSPFSPPATLLSWQENFKGIPFAPKKCPWERKIIPSAPPLSSDSHASPPRRPLTALAAYPGSGSTWLRLMVERTTGLQSNSIYCDKGLKVLGFEGECHKGPGQDPRYVVTKTHGPWRRHRTEGWHKAILLVRQPQQAIFSLFSSSTTGWSKVAEAKQSSWKEWRDSNALRELREWKRHTEHWLAKGNIPSTQLNLTSGLVGGRGDMVVVKYEDLLGPSTARAALLSHMLSTLSLKGTVETVGANSSTALEDRQIERERWRLLMERARCAADSGQGEAAAGFFRRHTWAPDWGDAPLLETARRELGPLLQRFGYELTAGGLDV